MLRKLAAVAAAGLLGALTFAGPAQAATSPHYPDAGWQLRQIATGDTEFSDADLSTIVDQDTVELTKPGGETGTSIETTNLGLPVSAGDTLTVDYTLAGGADTTAGAIRMFVYSVADADTMTEAPCTHAGLPRGDCEAIATSTPTGTLTIDVPFDGEIGTMGLVYDASNDTAGTVEFSDLRLNTTPIWFIDENKPHVTAIMQSPCETLTLIFDNSGPYTDGIGHLGPWDMTFDYRLPGDEQLPLEDDLEGLTISDPPLAGQPFDGLYNPVPVAAGDSTELDLDIENVAWVDVRLVRGAEQRLFFDWMRLDLVNDFGCEVDDGTGDDGTGDDGTGDDGTGGGDTGDDDKDLPATGAPMPLMVGGGLALLLAGAGAMLLARRRRVTIG